MPNAFPNVSGSSLVLTEAILAKGYEASRTSPRQRIILPLHRTQDAPVQRMLNFLQPGTYIPPHQHAQDGAIETIAVINGSLGFIFFDSAGKIEQTIKLSAPVGVIDFEPGLWHSMVALDPDTVMLEIKKGPYDADADKGFAAWAPAEGSPEAKGFLAMMESQFG